MSNENKEGFIRQSKYTSLTLTSTTEDGKTRTLLWGMREGYPRMTVFTDNEIKKGDGTMDYDKMIIAPFTVNKLGATIDLFREVLKEDKNDYEEIDCVYPKIENGVKSETEKVIRAKVRFGIDTKGICYFYIENSAGIKIKFNIAEDGWHVFRKGKGAVDNRTASDLSKRYAKAYLDLLYEFFESDAKSNGIVVSYIPVKSSFNNKKPYQNNKYKQNTYVKPEASTQEETKTKIKSSEESFTGTTLDDLF